MNFILIIVYLGSNSLTVSNQGTFKNMDECFEYRNDMIEAIGRPIINYQAICIANNGS